VVSCPSCLLLCTTCSSGELRAASCSTKGRRLRSSPVCPLHSGHQPGETQMHFFTFYFFFLSHEAAPFSWLACRGVFILHALSARPSSSGERDWLCKVMSRNMSQDNTNAIKCHAVNPSSACCRLTHFHPIPVPENCHY
jgi:hypothetical protein